MTIRIYGRLLALFAVSVLALAGCATAKQAPATAAAAPAMMGDADGCEIILELSGVNFAFDSSALSPAAQSALDGVASRLQFHEVKRVEIAGHTDSTGPEDYNQGLSERRAQSVADYLMKGGIAGSRMDVRGYGETQPVASNDTREGRAQNRRVQVIDLTVR